MGGVLWNAAGAAIVLPIYFLKERQASCSSIDHHRVPPNHAKALLVAALVSAIPMVYLLLPPYVSRSSSAQQTLITAFVLAPIICSIATHAFILSSISSSPSSSDRQKNSHSKSRFDITATYPLSALVSAAVHLSVLSTSLFSADPAISFSRVFLPAPWKAYGSFPTKLTEGAHLFLQYDYIYILLSCGLYTYLLLEPRLAAGDLFPAKVLATLPAAPAFWACVGITLITLVLGPAAAVSLGLWAREDQREREGQSSKKQ